MDQKRAERIREKIMNRLPKQCEDIIQKAKDINARLEQLPLRTEEQARQAAKIREEIYELQIEAKAVVKSGGDPSGVLKKKAEAEIKLQTLEEHQSLVEEAQEGLTKELFEQQIDLHRYLDAATTEVWTEESGKFTKELSKLLEAQEEWNWAMNFDVEGVITYRTPGRSNSRTELFFLNCLHSPTKDNLTRLLNTSKPDRLYQVEG